jgi:hypothetical protein
MDTASLSEQRQKIIDELACAAKLPGRDAEIRADQIQRDLARLRDGLTERLRSGRNGPAFGKDHAGLKAVNVALSLVASVEFPITSVQRSSLQEAHDELTKVPLEAFFAS